MVALPRYRLPACLAIAALAGCVPRAESPPPRPAPIQRPAPVRPTAPQAPTPPAAPPTAWQDGALTPGDWSYSGAGANPQATYASPDGPLFTLRCDAGRQINILRPGAPSGPITIVTGSGQRILPGSGNDGQAQATLPASDPLFEQIIFSRGRFLVRAAGGGDLVLPSWPEPARLVEECRA